MLDGCYLYKVREEIRHLALSARVDKIHQPGRNEVLLHLSSREGAYKLIISARPNGGRVGFTAQTPENPPVPPLFCTLLRKHLGGARLTDVSGFGLDRVLVLCFEGTGDLGDKTAPRLIVELLGRQSNLLLTDSAGRIIDCLHRTDLESSRLLLPGALYVPPTPPDKQCPLSTPPAVLAGAVLASGHETLFDAILATVDGVSPVLARELEFRAAGQGSVSIADFAATGQESLTNALETLRAALTAGDSRAYLVADPQRGPVDFSLIPLTQYANRLQTESFDRFSDCLERFYGEREGIARQQLKSDALRKLVNRLLTRTRNRLTAQQGDLKKTESREQLRVNGELIKANLHLIERGADACRLPNYYDPDCAELTIPLDKALSPVQNAARYFKLYKKQSTAAGLLNGLIESARAEVGYLETVLYAVETAAGSRELSDIQAELEAGSYLSARQSGGRKKPYRPASQPLEVCSADGFTILVGRNNTQNDELTLHTADKFDLWLHAKGIPGSHVIVRCAVLGGDFPPDRTLVEAAALAALHSRAGHSSGVPVDYTFVKHVRKPAGAKPGMVVYDPYHTVIP